MVPFITVRVRLQLLVSGTKSVVQTLAGLTVGVQLESTQQLGSALVPGTNLVPEQVLSTRTLTLGQLLDGGPMG